MRYSVLSAITMFLLFYVPTNGQNYNDVIRFSRATDIGSARYTSMGGAFSALGNDFSAVQMNPAGLAVYRSGEMSFSSYYRNTSTSTTYYGQSQPGVNGNFRFNQFGIVFNTDLDNGEAFNFGIRYTRTNDYGFEHQINASNPQGSIVDQWFNNAVALSPQSSDLWNAGLYYEQLAADVELIGFNSTSQSWEQYAWGTDIDQKESFVSEGGRGEFAIDLAYKTNDLHFGGSIVFPTIYYSYTEVLKESNYATASSLKSMELTDYNRITGSGFQLNVGALWTPKDFGRFSAYIHSPTWWSFRQNGSLELTSYDRVGGGNLNSYQPFNDFLWSLQTPMTFGAGYAFVFGKYGILSADYSFQSFAMSSVSSKRTPGELSYLNNDIASELSNMHNLRLGGELRLDKWFIRAGYHSTSSPYKELSIPTHQITSGLGYKANKWGIDIAYARRMKSDSFYLYSSEYTEAVSRTTSDNVFIASFFVRL